MPELERGLKEFLRYYNRERMHQGLNYQTPANVYKAGQARVSSGSAANVLS